MLKEQIQYFPANLKILIAVDLAKNTDSSGTESPTLSKNKFISIPISFKTMHYQYPVPHRISR
jgi:hypothetical protein